MWRRAANALPPHFVSQIIYHHNNMEKVTYGAPRLMDWIAQIKAGAATVTVHFTGGALTVYGVTPAQYTTTNPVIQKAIEMSSYFKEGRITLIKRVQLTSPAKPGKAKKTPKPQPLAQEVSPAEEKKEQSATVPAPEVVEESTTETKSDNATPASEESEQTETEVNDAALISVEVSCLQDAQDHLQQNFSIPSYKVRTYESAQKAAMEHGILFVGGKFAPLGSSTEETKEEVAEDE